MSDERSLLTAARRVVVKIGSRLVAEAPASRPATIADQVVELRRRDVEVVVVSSGAIALGMRRLGLTARPTELPGLQAAAAVGQSRLMQHWEHAFAAHGIEIGQVLVTHDDLADRRRFLSARLTLRALRDAGKSLLPAGIVSVDGEFELGDTVAVVTRDGAELARGLAAYPAADLRKIQGLQSAAIEARLGYKSIDEAIHRDDLVIL